VRIHNTTPTPIYDDLIGSIYICKDDFFIYISPYGSAQCNLASLLLLLNFHLIPGALFIFVDAILCGFQSV